MRSLSTLLLFLLPACSLPSAELIDGGEEEPSPGSGGSNTAPESSTGGASSVEADNKEIELSVEELEIAPEQWGYHVTSRRDLSELLPAGTTLGGVTRDPQTNEIYVLDPVAGIYHLTDSAAELIYSPDAIVPEDGLEPQGAFSDLAALGGGRFALTSPNEGYIVDLSEGRMWRHFCYLPRSTPGLDLSETSISLSFEAEGIEVWQSTGALAYEAEADLLWAQPITRRLDDDSILGAEIASFNLGTGEPLAWYRFADQQVVAGALAVKDDSYYLGFGSFFLVFSRSLGEFLGGYNLEDLTEISGLHAQEDGTFLTVDSAQVALLTVALTNESDNP